MPAAALGMLLGVGVHTAPAADADSAEVLSAGALLYSYLGEARGAASLPAQRTANLDEIRRRTDDPARGSFDGGAAPVDRSLSDLPARLHDAFGSDLRSAGDRAREAEREILPRNADALVRAKVPLTFRKKWLGFVYADIGAADSAPRWQGLIGIRIGHGVDLVGGWRHITYYFSPGRGLDSLDFNGPFLGAARAW